MRLSLRASIWTGLAAFLLQGCDDPKAAPSTDVRKAAAPPVTVSVSAEPRRVPAPLRGLVENAEVIPGFSDPVLSGRPAALPRPAEPEEKALIDEARRALDSGLSAEEALAALEPLDGLKVAEILAVADDAGRHADSAVRLSALDLLGGMGGREVYERLRAALSDPYETVRLTAIEGAATLDTADARDLISAAFENPSAAVRKAAFSISQSLDAGTAALARTSALGGGDPLVQALALEASQTSLTIPEVSNIIPLLDSTSYEVRNTAADLLALWTRHTFSKAHEAGEWWRENAKRFSYDMSELTAEEE